MVLFLLASLTVLVQILGAAKRTSREARELSTAVSIAQNAAELFAASGSQEDFAALLGAEKTARGTLRRKTADMDSKQFSIYFRRGVYVAKIP